MTKRIFQGVAVLSFLLGCISVAEAFTFSVQPVRLELTAPVGKRRGQSITVDNSRANKPVHLKIYVQDVVYLPDGTHDFPPPGSTTWSCASFLQVNPTELDIPAGKVASVRISALPPEGTTGGHYAIVFFESSPSYAEGSGVGVNFRIGALVEIIVPGTEVRQAKLANISVESPQNITVEIFNEGNVLLRPKGKLKISQTNGKRVAQVEFNQDRLGVLPNTLRKYAVTLEKPLGPGSYQLRAEIDQGTKYLLVGELPFTIP
ncbi:MAG: hypothetical protein HYT88_02915 [Candidatus Omnitrophica bacterium]|nr:hypothetical protein [Candidatus Omnitrophota bacterium]MBI2174569.1 hypothetical protein [Candidatus Omnitrophota bacterium]MBI3009474.1 hypothetical protein [Candidatus Omnitrophota bacterium]